MKIRAILEVSAIAPHYGRSSQADEKNTCPRSIEGGCVGEAGAWVEDDGTRECRDCGARWRFETTNGNTKRVSEAEQRYVVFNRSDVGEEVEAHNVSREEAINAVQQAIQFQKSQADVDVRQVSDTKWEVRDDESDLTMYLSIEPVRSGNVYGDAADLYDDDD